MSVYSQLFLRSISSPYGDFTRNSVLSFKDLDQNFIFLKERDINSINYSSNTLTIETLGGNSFSTTISPGGGGGSSVWTSGSTGLYSIKANNISGLDATANYSVASGFNTLASGNVSFTHSTNSTASSDYTSILGGQNNGITSSSNNSSIVGGTGNTIDGSTYSFIAGGSDHTIHDASRNGILGGYNQTIQDSANNAIVGGRDLTIAGSSNNNLLGGGDDNTIHSGSTLSAIIGGVFHDLRQASKTVIIGGQSHETNTSSSEDAIIGGYDGHFTNTQQTVMLGGKGNFTNTNNTGAVSSVNLNANGTSHSFFGGGEDHTGSSNHAAIIGGSGHTISGNRSVILGGINITATASDTVYVPNLEVRGQAYTPIYDNLTGGTTFVPDWDNSNVQILTLSGNTNISGGTSTMEGGSTYTVIVKQSNGGSHTITWDSTYKWEAGSAPTLTVADGSVDIITFICDGTSLYGLIAKDFQ
jgi:hypothetical protein